MNEAPSIGVLAYGSLGHDPGEEIWPLIVERIGGVKTPFPVEFARQSRTRGGAPTLVPVSEGGACVPATVLVLADHVSEAEAADMLWRRETRREGSGESYDPPSEPGPNKVLVRRLEGFAGLDVVLYAEIGANIPGPDAQKLAELAIRSVRSEAGKNGKDGVSYLIGVRNNGVQTPLTPGYERQILRRTGTRTLEEAREKLAGRQRA